MIRTMIERHALARQIMHDAELVIDCRRYAESIGCTVGEGACYDEIECHTEEQWGAMRKWWQDHA